MLTLALLRLLVQSSVTAYMPYIHACMTPELLITAGMSGGALAQVGAHEAVVKLHGLHHGWIVQLLPEFGRSFDVR